jgi:hypothetical protein
MVKIYANVVAIALLTTTLLSCNDDPERIESATIEVDFAVPVANKSMSGFLHGLSVNNPPDSLITTLKPKLLRSGELFFSVYDRKVELQARPILVITDLWYGHSNGFETMPYDDYDAYRDFLLDVIDRTRGLDVIYDIWNEPDQTGGDFTFWKGTQEQFFETFKITHDILRAESDGEVVISGPSTHWSPEYLDDFLRYCLAHDVQLDVLSWHDFQSSNDISQVATKLSQMRSAYLENPAFALLGIREIHINEYGLSDKHLVPAFVLAYLYYLEVGKADGACRTCWHNCWNSSISDLLTDALDPRAAWWVHKYYAESNLNRVQSSTNQRYLVPFASFASTGDNKAQVLLANHYTSSIEDVSITLKNIASIPGFADAQEVRAVWLKIPATDMLPLFGPLTESETILPVVGNTITIEREAFPNEDAFIVELFPVE